MKKMTLLIAVVAGAMTLSACSGDEKPKAAGEAAAAEKGDAEAGGAKAGAEDSEKGAQGDSAAAQAAASEAAPPAPVSMGDLPKATGYVPDSAMLVAHVDIARLTSTEFWGEGEDDPLAVDPEAKKVLEAFESCDLKMDRFQSLTIGRDEGNNTVVVVAGEGVGKRESLECISKAMEAERGAGSWKLQEVDGKLTVDVGGRQIGHPVDENTFVMNSKGWNDKVEELLAGAGKPAVMGRLADAVSHADTKQSLWFAGRLPAMAEAQLRGSPAEGLGHIAGSVDLTKGLAVVIKAGTATPEKAQELKLYLDKTYGQVKAMASMMGIPPHIADKVEFGVAGSQATAKLNLTREEVEQLKADLQAQSQRAGAAGRPPMPPATPPPAG